MEDIYSLIQERNARETLPFLSIHASNTYLRNSVDVLQARCESLEHQYLEQQQLVAEQAQAIKLTNDSEPAKNEARLREQVTKLQTDLNIKIQNEVKHSADALNMSNELSTLKEENTAHETTISNLRIEVTRCNEINTHLTTELENSKSIARLADKQIDGLKTAIRTLQEENDEVTKLNKRLVDEAVAEKEKMAEQFNNMNDTIETLQKEAAMLRQYAKEMAKKGPLGGPVAGWIKGLNRADKNILSSATADNAKKSDEANTEPRKWGTTTCAVVPTQPLYTIKAHKDDASCVRYDGTNLNRVATSSSDATVKVFDTGNGQVEATFSAGGRQPLLGVDIGGNVVCGCGADKTCR